MPLYIWLPCVLLSLSTALTGTHTPNVVIILVDDLGWSDLGSSGSTFYETPNIDRLASEACGSPVPMPRARSAHPPGLPS